jgi:hypothetical protein
MIKEKIYKRRIYWLSTKTFCGAVAVDQDGLIYGHDTAPYFKKLNGTKFRELLDSLKWRKELLSCKKIAEEEDPF